MRRSTASADCSEFGDGIMSAIDFDVAIERQPNQKGGWVRLTMSRKFLPYKQY